MSSRLGGQIWSGGGAETDGAETLEAHVRLHITHPNRGPDSPEGWTEDRISPVRAYLK
ncbi:MAG TPA: hypothetical protein VIH75_03920 [Candidatus Sulfotelmatobacter sp.]